MAEAADHDGGERDARDQEKIEQPPIGIFAVDIFRAGPNLDVGKPAQAEHAEAQDVRQEFRPEIGEALQQLAGIPGVKITEQPHVQNQQRHGDAKDSIAEGVETRLRKHVIPRAL
ncbi:hypothetical protein SAMN05443248_3627 [Bradyrhizobium erythrophlei]|uniref:Uncharacterized protein n=1 Tax=Bradyrhizobium erythrophlei TaxID=1437360 RepID=A0A1M5Q3C6_9BRAD|nr:hypothetical protein SAMN05443248_3627 [Bradyrhizobium erythrophlei]